MIRAINAARRPVLALDIPSGVDADTGAVHEEAVRADITLSFESDRLSGSGGCNWYTGWLEKTNGALTISDLAATRTDCLHPRIMSREARYLADLERFTVLRWAGDALAMMADENRNGWLLFTRAPPLLRGG